jgi:hypothetical protein
MVVILAAFITTRKWPKLTLSLKERSHKRIASSPLGFFMGELWESA